MKNNNLNDYGAEREFLQACRAGQHKKFSNLLLKLISQKKPASLFEEGWRLICNEAHTSLVGDFFRIYGNEALPQELIQNALLNAVKRRQIKFFEELIVEELVQDHFKKPAYATEIFRLLLTYHEDKPVQLIFELHDRILDENPEAVPILTPEDALFFIRNCYPHPEALQFFLERDFLTGQEIEFKQILKSYPDARERNVAILGEHAIRQEKKNLFNTVPEHTAAQTSRSAFKV